jgi:hypothetical protein
VPYTTVTERRSDTRYGGAMGGTFRWETTKKGMEQAHVIGCTSVSWAPADAPGALVSAGAAAVTPMRRLCSAGCDNTVKVVHRRDPSCPAPAQRRACDEGRAVRAVSMSHSETRGLGEYGWQTMDPTHGTHLVPCPRR